MKWLREIGKVVFVVAAVLAGVWVLSEENDNLAGLDKLETEMKVLQSDFVELCRKAHELEDLLPSDADWPGFSCDPEGFGSRDEDEGR